MSEKRNLGSIYIPPVPDGEKEIINLINRLGVVQDNQIAKLLCVKPSEMDSFLYYMDDLYTKKDRFEIDGHLINNIVVNDMDIAEQILDTYELLVPSVFTLVDHSNIDSNGRPKVSYFKAE